MSNKRILKKKALRYPFKSWREYKRNAIARRMGLFCVDTLLRSKERMKSHNINASNNDNLQNRTNVEKT